MLCAYTKLLVDMPDLTTEKNVQMLERWEGSWAYLSNLEWVKITASGAVRSCNFPPQTN
jgi:translation machinery-associated protein 16